MSVLNMVLPGGGKTYELGVLSSDKTEIELDYSQTSDTFTISYNGDGNIVIENSNPEVCSVELVSGTTYRVSGIGDGEATLTVSAMPTMTYFTPGTVEIGVSYVSMPPASNILSENDWETISLVSTAGAATNYWSVGDRKAITLNGKVGGNLTLSNTTLYVYILGFDHNASKEGSGISFGTFKTALSGGTDVALIDSGYSINKTSGTWFNMNNSSSNSNGWKKCRMRYYVLGSTDSSSGNDASATTATSPVSNTLMAALPSELRAVMKSITKYSDNTGVGSDTASYVTATKDFLPLLAEWEVFGAKVNANSAEQNNQAQYQYYVNGNSKMKYKYSNTSSACAWWLRSVYSAGSSHFCIVSANNGNASTNRAYYSYGVAPMFLV